MINVVYIFFDVKVNFQSIHVQHPVIEQQEMQVAHLTTFAITIIIRNILGIPYHFPTVINVGHAFSDMREDKVMLTVDKAEAALKTDGYIPHSLKFAYENQK